MSTPTKPDIAFLVDVNFYLWRIFSTTMYEAKDPAQNVCNRLLSMVCREAMAVRAKSLLLCLDGGSVFRYKLYPEYKANRKREDGPSPYDHVDYIIAFFGRLGFPFSHRSAYEADDLMCSGAKNHPGQVVLGTRDKDMFQFLDDRVCMYDSSAKPEPQYIRAEDMHKHFRVPPSLCLDYQTLVGDKVDNVPVLMLPAQARKGLLLHGSFQAWWKADKELRSMLDPEAVRLNRKLVKMVDSLDVRPSRPARSTEHGLSKAYYDYLDFVYPRTRSLF